MADDRLDELRARLDDIAEELAEMGLAKLREAIETESPGAAAASERRLGRARRAVLKASALLGGAGESDEE